MAKKAKKQEVSTELFTVEKNAEYTLQNATQEAVAKLETFEGNIKIVDEDETHIVFAKVRE